MGNTIFTAAAPVFVKNIASPSAQMPVGWTKEAVFSQPSFDASIPDPTI